MNGQNVRCSDERLLELLNSDQNGDDVCDAVAHLEHCPRCQERLEALAAEPQDWRLAHECLSLTDAEANDHDDHAGGRWGTMRRQRAPSGWSESMAKQLLAPPSHPEMLGRIGRYEVERVIGFGGMGVVFKAFDTELNRPVAVKVLAPYLAASRAARKRFAREARAAAAIVHEHVVAIHNVETEADSPFLVMHYVAGESLQQRLDREGWLNLCETLRIGLQTAAGLAAAHAQGLVHRDVKPSNILLEERIERALLTDFGLARASHDARVTYTGYHPGTPQYMSPEQVRGEPLDGRSDLFSLGCVLYEMATGVSPFRADSVMATMRSLVDDTPQSVASLNPELPPWFVAIVERLLQKEASNRYATAAEVSDLLENCLAHVQQPATVPLPVAIVTPAASRSFSPRGLRVLMMIAAFGIAVLGMFLASATPPDIAGEWIGEGWGIVNLGQSKDRQYVGTFSETQNGESVKTKIQLTWSRLERRFNGTWRDGADRSGEISIRLTDGEIRGAYTVLDTSETRPETPRLADLVWRKRIVTEAKPQIASSAHASQTSGHKKLSSLGQKLVGQWEGSSFINDGTIIFNPDGTFKHATPGEPEEHGIWTLEDRRLVRRITESGHDDRVAVDVIREVLEVTDSALTLGERLNEGRGTLTYSYKRVDLRCELHPDKQSWNVGEAPVFVCRITNTGKVNYPTRLEQSFQRIEVDGHPYVGTGHATSAIKSISAGGQAEIRFTLAESDWVPLWTADFRVNERLQLSPGRHLVRVCIFTGSGGEGSLRDPGAGPPIQTWSNAVEIEVVAGDRGKTTSIRAGDGDSSVLKPDDAKITALPPAEYVRRLQKFLKERRPPRPQYCPPADGPFAAEVKKADLANLIELLAINEECSATVKPGANVTPAYGSTIGHEAAVLIDSFRLGVPYPIANSSAEHHVDREILKWWWIGRNEQKNKTRAEATDEPEKTKTDTTETDKVKTEEPKSETPEVDLTRLQGTWVGEWRSADEQYTVRFTVEGRDFTEVERRASDGRGITRRGQITLDETADPKQMTMKVSGMSSSQGRVPGWIPNKVLAIYKLDNRGLTRRSDIKDRPTDFEEDGPGQIVFGTLERRDRRPRQSPVGREKRDARAEGGPRNNEGDKEPERDLARLQGTWLGELRAADERYTVRLTIEGRRFTEVQHRQSDGREITTRGQITLDETADPKQMTMKVSGMSSSEGRVPGRIPREVLAIYKFDGGGLTRRIGLRDRPTEFEEDGPGQIVFDRHERRERDRKEPRAADEKPGRSGAADQPDDGKPRRADVLGRWYCDEGGLAGVFITLDLKDDGTFVTERREIAPKFEAETHGTWEFDDRTSSLVFREKQWIEAGKAVERRAEHTFITPLVRTDGRLVLTHPTHGNYYRLRVDERKDGTASLNTEAGKD